MKIVFGICLITSWLALYLFQGAPTPRIRQLDVEVSQTELSVKNPAVLVVNMIPNDQSSEQGQDSEPFLAVSVDPDDSNKSILFGSAFQGKYQESGATPLLLSSTDGGWTWESRSILPAKQIGSHTYCFSGKKNSLYGSVLVIEQENQSVSVFHTNDPTTDVPLNPISTLTSGGEYSDAPFIQAHAFGDGPTTADEPDKRIENIFVGQNYFGFSGPQKTRTAAIRVSNDNGQNFNLFGLEARDTGSAKQDGPVVRPAVANDRTVYVAFLHWSAKEGNTYRGDVVVSRDDNAGVGDNSFLELIDPSDGLPGRIVVRNRLFSVFEKMDQQRIVSPLSLAVNPENSATVYIAWGDYDKTAKAHVLHVKKSTDKGQNWSEDIRNIEGATNPALAVSATGVVGLLFQQLVGTRPGETKRWETHFQSSLDGSPPWTDVRLAVFPTEKEPRSESELGPYLGYRSHLLAIGPSFYGIFSAPNNPEQRFFPEGVRFQRHYLNGRLFSAEGKEVKPSIDPYFFRVNVNPEPNLLSLQQESQETKQLSPRTWLGTLTSARALIFIIAFFALTVAAVELRARRINRINLITTESLRKELHGPPLINYKGYVSACFTDVNGNAIDRPSLTSESMLIVTFADKARGVKSEQPINLDGGEDAPEVVFTVVIDSVDFDAEPDHKMVSVPTTGMHEFAFRLRPLHSSQKESLFVQVFQKTKLVQVVSHM